ncbi:hypothetical protein D0962_09590 [Leptolyngbyaceae cyanobacterium CCMR0082]|uniref:Uncharacterized protein n=1 Tax=Adonisia turfae CCMR0082 TaxID=2304604 RepID=A0A6M0S3Y7_9CYAN|nr:hypothetical protein [Adonisia turfae]NEZ63030.1 hypothetical protein [Adonisia turfae CCMR0082]
MATRSLTYVKDEQGAVVACIYRQFDGYIKGGHGEEIASFLKDFSIVNGLSGQREKVANGARCLAAQLVASLKSKPGLIYLEPTDTPAEGVSFVYEISANPGKEIKVDITSFDEVVFSGTPEQLAQWEPVNEEE